MYHYYNHYSNQMYCVEIVTSGLYALLHWQFPCLFNCPYFGRSIWNMFCLNMTLSRWTVSSMGLKPFVTTQVSIIFRKSADTKLTCPVNHEKPIKADYWRLMRRPRFEIKLSIVSQSSTSNIICLRKPTIIFTKLCESKAIKPRKVRYYLLCKI